MLSRRDNKDAGIVFNVLLGLQKIWSDDSRRLNLGLNARIHGPVSP